MRERYFVGVAVQDDGAWSEVFTAAWAQAPEGAWGSYDVVLGPFTLKEALSTERKVATAAGWSSNWKRRNANAHARTKRSHRNPSTSWAFVFDAVDAEFPLWNAANVTDWNKVNARFRGHPDSGAIAHWYSEYRSGRVTRAVAIQRLKKEGVSVPYAYARLN